MNLKIWKKKCFCMKGKSVRKVPHKLQYNIMWNTAWSNSKNQCYIANRALWLWNLIIVGPVVEILLFKRALHFWDTKIGQKITHCTCEKYTKNIMQEVYIKNSGLLFELFNIFVGTACRTEKLQH